MLENNSLPVDGYEKPVKDQVILEKISLGLRTADGLGLEELSVVSGAVENIKKLEVSGHIQICNNRVIPTKKGLLVADQLPLYIIN